MHSLKKQSSYYIFKVLDNNLRQSIYIIVVSNATQKKTVWLPHNLNFVEEIGIEKLRENRKEHQLLEDSIMVCITVILKLHLY